MSAYFRGSNPHQADFMQQGRCWSAGMFAISQDVVFRQGASEARARQTGAAGGFCCVRSPLPISCKVLCPNFSCFRGRSAATTTRLITRIKTLFKSKHRDVARTSSGAVELQDLAEGDMSPLSPVRRQDSSSYAPEDDV